MPKYVWCTIGENRKERDSARAVLLEASSLKRAKERVADQIALDMVVSSDEERFQIREDELANYGSTWFVQQLSNEELV